MNTLTSNASPQGKFLTLSNLLSLLRLVLAIPFVLVLLARAPWSKPWAIIILVAGVVSDRYDGILARKFHQETEWGRILDPLADKVAMVATVVVFSILGLLPVWFVVMVVARDLGILIGGMVLKFRTGNVLPSNQTGKWAVGIMALTMFATLVEVPEQFIQFLLGASVVMLIVSLVLYVRRFVEVIGQSAQGGVRTDA